MRKYKPPPYQRRSADRAVSIRPDRKRVVLKQGKAEREQIELELGVVVRPITRADCLPGGHNALRPCPFVSCKHHLALDVNPYHGSLKLNFPGRDLETLPATCALDVAAKPRSLKRVAPYLNLTDRGLHLIETTARRKLRAQLNGDDLVELAHQATSPTDRFRCTVLNAVLTGDACLKRRAYRDAAGRTPHYQCQPCRIGAEHARLFGDAAKPATPSSPPVASAAPATTPPAKKVVKPGLKTFSPEPQKHTTSDKPYTPPPPASSPPAPEPPPPDVPTAALTRKVEKETAKNPPPALLEWLNDEPSKDPKLDRARLRARAKKNVEKILSELNEEDEEIVLADLYSECLNR